MARFAVTFAAALLALVALSVAFAHSEPATVKPGDGAVLAKSPAQIELTMTQDMARQGDANDIDVFDASGKEVTTVSAAIDNGDRKKLSVPLPSGLPSGVYTVKWKTVSADDGDPANGSYTFTVDPSKPPSAGIEAVKPSILGGDSQQPASGLTAGGGSGTSWVLVAAVAVGAFVLGGGTSFLLIQKRS